MASGRVRNDNTALAGIAAAVTAMNEKAGSAAHVAVVRVQVVAGWHTPELDFAADGVAAERSERRKDACTLSTTYVALGRGPIFGLHWQLGLFLQGPCAPLHAVTSM